MSMSFIPLLLSVILQCSQKSFFQLGLTTESLNINLTTYLHLFISNLYRKFNSLLIIQYFDILSNK